MDKNDFGLKPWDLTSTELEPAKELDPYEKLFMAILCDAVELLKRRPKAIVNRYIGKRQYKVKEPAPRDPIGDAWNWLMSDDEDWCLCFAVICHHFHWSHTDVRKRALEAIKKARKEGRRCNLVATDGKRRRKWG